MVRLMDDACAKSHSHLCEMEFGYSLLDALTQANIDYRSVSLETMKELLVDYQRTRQRIATLTTPSRPHRRMTAGAI